MKPVARRPSITSSTSLWASGYMGWPRDATGGLPQDQKASRAPQAGSCRGFCSRSTAVIPTASTVAEGGIGSMLDAYFGCALRAVVPCARAVHLRCLGGALISGRCQDRSMCGSWLLPGDTDCVWCASQVRPRPDTRMVSVVVATPRGDPRGKVPGGARSELRSSPQSFGDVWRCWNVFGGVFRNYLSRQKNYSTCRTRVIHASAVTAGLA